MERRLQPTLGGQGIDHPTARRLGEQAQGLVQVGLAAAIGSGNLVEPVQRHDQLVDRTVVGDGQGREHGALPCAGEQAVSPFAKP
ncbi:hypothetical protein D3C80_1894870 [compost metagenome]